MNSTHSGGFFDLEGWPELGPKTHFFNGPTRPISRQYASHQRETSMKRRHFLSRAAVATAGGLFAAPVGALVIEAAPPAIDAAYALRCQVDPMHAALLQEARDKLGQNKEAQAALDAIAKDLKQAMICPYCGCNLTLEGAPSPEKARF
jgi:hypothetical protein